MHKLNNLGEIVESINKVILQGRVYEQVPLRYTDTGRPYLRFRVITTQHYKKVDEWQTSQSKHWVTLWGEQAEELVDYLLAQTWVYVEGRLHTRVWVDRAGVQRSVSDVVANILTIKQQAPDGHEEEKDKPLKYKPLIDTWDADLNGATNQTIQKKTSDVDDLPF